MEDPRPVISANAINGADVIRANLASDDIVGEIHRVINQIRERSSEIDQYGRRVTILNGERPVMRLEIEYYVNNTMMVINKEDLYGYSMFAGNGWRNCTDSPWNLAEHVEDGPAISCRYVDTSYNPTLEYGRSVLVSNLCSLRSSNMESWRPAFKSICHHFLEAAGFTDIYAFILTSVGSVYGRNFPMGPKLQCLINSWTELGEAIKKFDRGQGWSLSEITVGKLGFSTQEEAVRSVAVIHR